MALLLLVRHAVTEATGRISAIGRVIHIGGKVAVAESRILDADGVLYAHSTSTCAIKRAASASNNRSPSTCRPSPRGLLTI